MEITCQCTYVVCYDPKLYTLTLRPLHTNSDVINADLRLKSENVIYGWFNGMSNNFGDYFSHLFDPSMLKLYSTYLNFLSPYHLYPLPHPCLLYVQLSMEKKKDMIFLVQVQLSLLSPGNGMDINDIARERGPTHTPQIGSIETPPPPLTQKNVLFWANFVLKLWSPINWGKNVHDQVLITPADLIFTASKKYRMNY